MNKGLEKKYKNANHKEYDAYVNTPKFAIDIVLRDFSQNDSFRNDATFITSFVRRWNTYHNVKGASSLRDDLIKDFTKILDKYK